MDKLPEGKKIQNAKHFVFFIKQNMTKKQTSVYLVKEDIELYERLYPKTLGIFLQKAIHQALLDKELFYKIFTSELGE